ncbi:hypothetical protein K7711_36375 [Nocardia sp. CA2R105]|nr:hypothetical protein [Nocardia coffeae]
MPNAHASSGGIALDRLAALRRFDIPTSSLPSRAGRLRRRVDLPSQYGTASSSAPAVGRFSVATEWMGRLAAVMALALVVLVLISVHKGLKVQHSARTVVDNFRTTNQFFSQRADLSAPATARKELDQLNAVLTQLNATTAADTNQLGNLLPDTRALLAAGQGDTKIANQLNGVAGTLAGAAGSLHQIAGDANTTVTSVDSQLGQAIDLANQLNAQLTRATGKLGPLPAQDGVIPAPGGKR